MKKGTQIHFILDNGQNKLIYKKITNDIPRAGDEIRIGGKGNEEFYKITRVVWVYDEPEYPLNRVNIGVIKNKA